MSCLLRPDLYVQHSNSAHSKGSRNGSVIRKVHTRELNCQGIVTWQVIWGLVSGSSLYLPNCKRYPQQDSSINRDLLRTQSQNLGSHRLLRQDSRHGTLCCTKVVVKSMALSIRNSLDAVSLSSLGDQVEFEPGLSDSEEHNPRNICLRCRFLDFNYVGWHESDTDESNGYLLTREYSAIVSSATNCDFCDQIVSTVQNWFQTRSASQRDQLDLPRAGVDVKLETDWHELKSSKSGTGKYGHYSRIKVHLSVPVINKGGSIKSAKHLTFFLQRAQNDEGTSEPEIYAGRKRPLIADLGLFKQWKDLCDEHHGNKCTAIFQTPDRVIPRLIDVQQRCVVDGTKDDAWSVLAMSGARLAPFVCRNKMLRTSTSQGH